jgi:two-component system chemotaxis sensor kinase CheA
MSFLSDKDAAELRELFFDSAIELVHSLSDACLELERRPKSTEALSELRRAVHTLKGDAAAVGFFELSTLAHELEAALTAEACERAPGAVVQAALMASDVFTEMLQAWRGKSGLPDASELRAVINNVCSAEKIVPTQAAETSNEAGRFEIQLELCNPAMKSVAREMVARALGGIGEMLCESEASPAELSYVLISTHSPEEIEKTCRIPAVISSVAVTPLRSLPSGDRGVSNLPRTPTAVTTGTRLRVDAHRVDAVLNLISELVIGKSALNQLASQIVERLGRDPLRSRLGDAIAKQSATLNELQKLAMRMRMIPVEQVFRRFVRVVRDVSLASGKEVSLEIAGGETELDKSVLDVLVEPLTHLIRNAVDHGIEAPAERLAAGKSRTGTVRLTARQRSNHIEIECADDGRGIQKSKLLARAIECGAIRPEEAQRLSEQEMFSLIFDPSLSTAEEITEVSGRGVGMYAVKAALESVKGSVVIDSTEGAGTTFVLRVPLTLAITPAMMFTAGAELYAVPMDSVLEIARVSSADIHIYAEREFLLWRNTAVPVCRIAELGSSHDVPANPAKREFVVLVSSEGQEFALVADRLVGEEELVTKTLSSGNEATGIVSGAAILGDGRIALVLDLSALRSRTIEAAERGLQPA